MKTFRILVVLVSLSLLYTPRGMAAIPVPIPASEDPTAIIVNGMKDFKNLPRSERKARLKEIRMAMKEYRANRRAGKESEDNILAIVFAILIPPLGVYLYEKKITTKFWISLLLTLLFWLPGAIYALLVVTGNA